MHILLYYRLTADEEQSNLQLSFWKFSLSEEVLQLISPTPFSFDVDSFKDDLSKAVN